MRAGVVRVEAETRQRPRPHPPYRTRRPFPTSISELLLYQTVRLVSLVLNGWMLLGAVGMRRLAPFLTRSLSVPNVQQPCLLLQR